MPDNTMLTTQPATEGFPGPPAAALARRAPEVWLFTVLLVGLNLHTVGVDLVAPQIFLPAAVSAGEWWRLATHPFVHVSWYHLLLDAGAFLCLYGILAGHKLHRRLVLLFGCGTGSLVATLWMMPEISHLGLGGLSGIGHGLLLVVGLDWAFGKNVDAPLRRVGWLCVAAVALKSSYEMRTGELAFSSMHLGLTGVPMVACHGGGALGGAAAWVLLRTAGRWQTGRSPMR